VPDVGVEVLPESGAIGAEPASPRVRASWPSTLEMPTTEALLRAGGTSNRDPPTLAVSVAVLILAALAACPLPARRATRTEPLGALRLI